ncbi:hypothetical protein LXL04_013273 [Taraxacum kok-saghyz]
MKKLKRKIKLTKNVLLQQKHPQRRKNVTGKSSVLMDVKPWDDETDMKKLEEAVRSVHLDGLLWGASKLVPVGYGSKKLQIMMTIVNDLVSVDTLIPKNMVNQVSLKRYKFCETIQAKINFRWCGKDENPVSQSGYQSTVVSSLLPEGPIESIVSSLFPDRIMCLLLNICVTSRYVLPRNAVYYIPLYGTKCSNVATLIQVEVSLNLIMHTGDPKQNQTGEDGDRRGRWRSSEIIGSVASEKMVIVGSERRLGNTTKKMVVLPIVGTTARVSRWGRRR